MMCDDLFGWQCGCICVGVCIGYEYCVKFEICGCMVCCIDVVLCFYFCDYDFVDFCCMQLFCELCIYEVIWLGFVEYDVVCGIDCECWQ